MNLKISRAAELDLEEIWLFSAETWSVEQADRYIHLIFDQLDHLCRQPESGSDVGDLRKGYRRVKVQSHQIFYRISSNREALEVMRILHGRMDFDQSL
jgi:toxin ParE1/3/4